MKKSDSPVKRHGNLTYDNGETAGHGRRLMPFGTTGNLIEKKK